MCGTCDSPDWDHCKGGSCRAGTGFSKPGGASDPYFCTKTGYNYYSQTSQKWEPCGRSPDIPATYEMGNSTNVTVQAMTISPSNQVSTCTGGNGDYIYYGDLTGPSVLTIIHPGVTDNVFFWQIRLMYEVITFDKWATTNQILTQFNYNISVGNYSDNITNTG